MHVMQWLQGREDTVASLEWSAVSVLLLAIYLNLGRVEAQTFQTTRLPLRRRRPPSGSFGSIRESADWKALEVGETANSLGCPTWMMNRGWEWALEEDIDDAMSPHGDQSPSPKFISKHIVLAKEFMASPSGEAAMGHGGFLPTAISRSLEVRRRVAVDLYLGLHLLLEEQKLDITTPEYVSPGRVDLRVILCQVARWLKWHDFWTVHELGVQEDIDQRHDSGMCKNWHF
jgi:anaphase-promoting complex subunit 1